MNLLYWNLHSNGNEEYISHLLNEHSIDIAIFSEYSKTDFKAITNSEISKGYRLCKSCGGCDKVIMLAKQSVQVQVSREHCRYVIYSVIHDLSRYIIVGTHLPSKPHADANDRERVIRELMYDLKEQEKKEKHSNSIIIGDFNASPFDKEIILKDTFNAVLFKEVIQKKNEIEYQGHKYRLLYNPILNHISENNHQYGSYYYTSGSNTLYWYCYDQILMSKNLVHKFDEMQYCQFINGMPLIKRLCPDKRISDHLPLVAKFKEGENNE